MKKLLLFALAASACSLARARPLENISLLWKPTTEVTSSGILPTSASIELKGIVDRRANPSLIAENHEDDRRTLPVTTKDNVPAWCTTHLAEVLHKSGFNVVEHGGGVVLSAELLRFFVLETGNYAGEVVLKVTVRNGRGNTLWSGVATGTAGRFGRSYKAENYYETLSDSLIDTVKQLRENQGFSRAVFRMH